MLKGAQLAAAQLNEDGGILGKDVEVVAIDDAADPATGVKAAKSVIADGLDGIVGPYSSGVGIETLPLYIKAGLVPIRLTSDASTNGLGFTLQPMTYQIAPVASQALTKWLDAETVAIAYDPTQNDTVSVSKALKGSLEKAGVTVTAYERVQPGRKSYADVVDKLAATKPGRHLRRRLLPRGRPDRQGDAAGRRGFPVHRRLRLIRHRLRRNRGYQRRAGLPGGRRAGARGLLRCGSQGG
jgi:branched-chain amino acid transport system substrate-binding protein